MSNDVDPYIAMAGRMAEATERNAQALGRLGQAAAEAGQAATEAMAAWQAPRWIIYPEAAARAWQSVQEWADRVGLAALTAQQRAAMTVAQRVAHYDKVFKVGARLAAAYQREIDAQRLAAYLGTRRTRRAYTRPRPRGDRR